MDKQSSRNERPVRRKRIMWIGAATLLLLSVATGCTAFHPEERTAAPPSAEADKPAEEAQEELTPEEIAGMSDEDLADQVQYYNEISLSKDEIQSKHPVATKIVNQKAIQQNVNPDLDNPKYRDLVKEEALNLEDKSPEEQKAIAEFAKAADQYENKENNKRIKELQDKAKREGLTEEERAELINLLPLKNPGPKLNPAPEDQSKDSAAPGDESTGNDGQDESPDEISGSGDNQQNGSDEQNEAPNDNLGNEPQNGSGAEPADDTQSAGVEPQGDGQGNESTDGDQDGAGQNGNDDGQNSGSAEPGSNEPPLKKEANGYDRAKAVEYAYMWWNKRNNEEYGYYSRSMGGCYNCWYDCTNFVSQVIKTGGIKERKGRYDWYDYWFYSDEKPSLTWGLAHSFYKHMKLIRQAQNAEWPSDLQVGDIISVDFEGDGDINHSVVITKIEDGEIYATYHSSDNKDRNITEWLDLYDVYAWKMETVKNNY